MLLSGTGSVACFKTVCNCLFSPPATDFALKTSDCPDTEYPVRIMNNERGCLWYKKDNKFKIPKGVIVFVSTVNKSCIRCQNRSNGKFKKSLAEPLCPLAQLTLLFSFSSSSIRAFPPHITCGSEISKKVS